MSSTATSNPLYCKVLLEELCIVGIFEQLEQQIQYLLSRSNVTELFEQSKWRFDLRFVFKNRFFFCKPFGSH